jgi:raffinose/stachyose/melibiose transport system permease protein
MPTPSDTSVAAGGLPGARQPAKNTRTASRPAVDTNVVFAKWWFLLPALAFYCFSVIIPSLIGIGAAFTNWDGISPTSHFVGLHNFIKMLSDSTALAALRQTVIIAVAITVLQNVVGLLLALGINSGIRSHRVLRVILFAPAVVAPVMTAYLWKYILAPGGALDLILAAIGLPQLQLNWLGSTDLALWCVVAVIVWQMSGLSMVIFLAGLEAISKDVLEAAELDGANAFTRFFYVTLPMLRPAVLVTTTLTLIGGLKQFDTVWAMTSGGPADSTQTLSTVIFQNAFSFGYFGYSIALAVVLTLIASPISWFQYRAAQREGV